MEATHHLGHGQQQQFNTWKDGMLGAFEEVRFNQQEGYDPARAPHERLTYIPAGAQELMHRHRLLDLMYRYVRPLGLTTNRLGAARDLLDLTMLALDPTMAQLDLPDDVFGRLAPRVQSGRDWEYVMPAGITMEMWAYGTLRVLHATLNDPSADPSIRAAGMQVTGVVAARVYGIETSLSEAVVDTLRSHGQAWLMGLHALTTEEARSTHPEWSVTGALAAMRRHVSDLMDLPTYVHVTGEGLIGANYFPRVYRADPRP